MCRTTPACSSASWLAPHQHSTAHQQHSRRERTRILCIASDLEGRQVGGCQLWIVIQHDLKVGHVPVLVDCSTGRSPTQGQCHVPVA